MTFRTGRHPCAPKLAGYNGELEEQRRAYLVLNTKRERHGLGIHQLQRTNE
jgi:hypothetical protein